MVKVKAVVEVFTPDENDVAVSGVVLLGKDTANLWVFVGDVYEEGLEGLEGNVYDTLVSLFPDNGADVENPFL